MAFFPKMKRFLPLRHYSCAPTTQGHLLDSFRWVEGARGHAGNCGHQFWQVPPFSPGGAGAIAFRGRHGTAGPHTEPAFRGFKPGARRVAADRFTRRFPLAAYAVPRAI